jgi:hypothetical protein
MLNFAFQKTKSLSYKWKTNYFLFKTLQHRNTYSTKVGKPTFGLFGDIHFQEKYLERIEITGEWIIDTFKKRNVNNIICLGDVLNTRESVSVQALSAAMRFFDKLSHIAKVHIVLG